MRGGLVNDVRVDVDVDSVVMMDGGADLVVVVGLNSSSPEDNVGGRESSNEDRAERSLSSAIFLLNGFDVDITNDNTRR